MSTASVSLDLDNLWAYLKTHGDPAWEGRPSFLPTAVPRLLEVFGEHGLTTTVFVVGADAEREDGARAVADIAAAGHEVANHSYGHEPWLHRYSRVELEAELVRTEDAITAAGAPRPTGFRGPGYSVTPTLLGLLAERGYHYDASTLPTWIGPLARAYHNRTAPDGGADDLFGGFGRVRAPNTAYRWRVGPGLVELPVTTMPLLRVPIHGSYLLQLHQVSPRLARGYFRTALRLCRARGVQPSLLLHPTDVLGAAEAPGMGFFPGMAVPGARKVAFLGWVLGALRAHFDVVGTGEHVRRLGAGLRDRDVDLPVRPA
ncbi:MULTISPECIES: polysaccharide deacetylase family protein [Saccharothrix]|uniref:Polysaccharide deacetylase n=1 Tax=Saccharothrix yanglingensis TaxID=659496 RepID=A0ABU0WW85_9PSEU|nr:MULTISPECIES: polysaccharide deacetylase family protein [Saccharothrix]MBY8851596.1 polysaccharide deacetylase family protein [Saccharothrix sp. MB29]MDQ2584037.1 polysaccharide deacetylase [Saccharothrix yanglingensis]MDU0290947.1 polysaccharide deacetylase family protein [Saccharothrix longispora]